MNVEQSYKCEATFYVEGFDVNDTDDDLLTNVDSDTHLFLNDVTLASCVECLLPLGLCSLSLLLLLLLPELLDSLQLLLDRHCLHGHHVPNLFSRHNQWEPQQLNCNILLFTRITTSWLIPTFQHLIIINALHLSSLRWRRPSRLNLDWKLQFDVLWQSAPTLLGLQLS